MANDYIRERTYMTDWETIIREYGPEVWRTAYRLLGNRSDADECMQEVFAAAVEVSRREPVENWAALLKRLAVLRGIDSLRRRGRDLLRGADDSEMLRAAGRETAPDAAAQTSELAARLRAALARLPGKHARAVCLRYINEMSYEEISR